MKRCLSCNEAYSDHRQGCPKCGGAGWCLDPASAPAGVTRHASSTSSAPTAVYVISGLFFIIAGLLALAAVLGMASKLSPFLMGGAVIMALVGSGLACLNVVAWIAALLLFTGNLVAAAIAFQSEHMAAHIFQIVLSLIVIAVLLGQDVRRAFSIH